MKWLFTVDRAAMTAYRIRTDDQAVADAVVCVPLISALLRSPGSESGAVYHGESWVVGEDAAALRKHRGEFSVAAEFHELQSSDAPRLTADDLKCLIGGIHCLGQRPELKPTESIFAINLNGDRADLPFWLIYALRRFNWKGAIHCLHHADSEHAIDAVRQRRAFAMASTATIEVPPESTLRTTIVRHRHLEQRIAVEVPGTARPGEVIKSRAPLPQQHTEDFSTTHADSNVKDGERRVLRIWYGIEDSKQCRTHVLSFDQCTRRGATVIAEVIRSNTLQNRFRARIQIDEWGRLLVSVLDAQDQFCPLRSLDSTRHPVLNRAVLIQHLTFNARDELFAAPDLPEQLDAVAYDGAPPKRLIEPERVGATAEVVDTLRLGVQKFVAVKGGTPRVAGADLLRLAAMVFGERKRADDPESDAWVRGSALKRPRGPFAPMEIAKRRAPEKAAWMTKTAEPLLEYLAALTPDELSVFKRELTLAARTPADTSRKLTP